MLNQLLHNLLLQSQRQPRVPAAEPWQGQDYDVQENPFVGRIGLKGVLDKIQTQRDEYWEKKQDLQNRFGNNPDAIKEMLRRYVIGQQTKDLVDWNAVMQAGQRKNI